MRRYFKAVKRAIRRNQTGQAILLLALGFIILLGFVGIVTDLSILYIRFASLRRAVDSAAVAAAGQFSRTVSDQENKERTQFAARQFLEFHGIDAENIVVDTCTSVRTYEDNDERVARYNLDYSAVEANMDTWVDEDWGLLNEYPDYIENEADPVRQEILQYRATLHNDVCRPERDGTLSGRKLVRVQASIAVPAPILSTVTGFFVDNVDDRATDIVLTAAAVSETASLDVVIVMDVSESMLFDTRYEDYDNLLFNAEGGGTDRIMRYLPPRMDLMYDEYELVHTGTPAWDSPMGYFQFPEEFSEAFLAEYLIGQFDVNAASGNYDHDGDGYLDPIPWPVDDNSDGIVDAVIDMSFGRYYMNGATPYLVDPGNEVVVGRARHSAHR